MESQKIANELFYESSIKFGFTYFGLLIPNIFGHFVSQIIILLFQRFAITFITVLSQKYKRQFR